MFKVQNKITYYSNLKTSKSIVKFNGCIVIKLNVNFS